MTEWHYSIDPDELPLFQADIEEHLMNIEQVLLVLEQGEYDQEHLRTFFRAAHTIKALGGVVGHHPMNALTHTLETLVQQMQEGRVALTNDLLDTFFTALDVLRTMSRDVLENRPPTPCDDVVQQLEQFLAVEEETPPAHGFTQAESDDIQAYIDDNKALLDIHIQADPHAFAPAARLYQAAIALLDIGRVIASEPNLERLTEETTTLRLIVRTDESPETVHRWLIEIPDLQTVHITPYLPKAIEQTAEQTSPETQSQEENEQQEEEAEEERDEKPAVSTRPSAEPAGKPSRRLIAEGAGVVRVPVDRLDTLLNLVGELITHRTRLVEIEAMLEDIAAPLSVRTALSDVLTQHVQTIEQIQHEVMQTRMLPLAVLFGRIPRLVRDIAHAQGKRVHVRIEGERTELDRSVIEMLQDPMLHLIRNAVDHGIELPEEREAAGKPPEGQIVLRAEQRQGAVYILVQDDGRGIDVQHVLEKAVAHGIISPEDAASMPPESAYALLFRTGFSTRETVSDISGRGVGLDIVHHAIERIGGAIMVQSEPGQGTTFTLRLPLTLLITRALLFTAGKVLFAVPLMHVQEILRFGDAQRVTVHGKPAIRWNGQVVPIIALQHIFNDEALHVQSPTALIVLARNNDFAAIPVTHVEDERDIVMKQLGRFAYAPDLLTGCTILGDGRIAFILDHHLLARNRD